MRRDTFANDSHIERDAATIRHCRSSGTEQRTGWPISLNNNGYELDFYVSHMNPSNRPKELIRIDSILQGDGISQVCHRIEH